MTRAKHRKVKPRLGWQWIYNGRDLVGVIEQQPDGSWRLVLDNPFGIE